MLCIVKLILSALMKLPTLISMHNNTLAATAEMYIYLKVIGLKPILVF